MYSLFSEIQEFHERADHFIQVADTLSDAVEKEKMRAIGARNLIKSMSKQREAKEQQLLVCIIKFYTKDSSGLWEVLELAS